MALRRSRRRQEAVTGGADDVPMQLDSAGAALSSNIPPPTSTNFPPSIDSSIHIQLNVQ